jgi:hypothetical protein
MQVRGRNRLVANQAEQDLLSQEPLEPYVSTY